MKTLALILLGAATVQAATNTAGIAATNPPVTITARVRPPGWIVSIPRPPDSEMWCFDYCKNFADVTNAASTNWQRIGNLRTDGCTISSETGPGTMFFRARKLSP